MDETVSAAARLHVIVSAGGSFATTLECGRAAALALFRARYVQALMTAPESRATTMVAFVASKLCHFAYSFFVWASSHLAAICGRCLTQISQNLSHELPLRAQERVVHRLDGCIPCASCAVRNQAKHSVTLGIAKLNLVRC